MGMIIGTSLQTVVLCFIIWKTNWSDEVTTKEIKTKPLLFFLKPVVAAAMLSVLYIYIYINIT